MMALCEEKKKLLIQLIDLYRSLPALWQIKSKEYRDRQDEDSAHETLLTKYNSSPCPNLTWCKNHCLDH